LLHQASSLLVLAVSESLHNTHHHTNTLIVCVCCLRKSVACAAGGDVNCDHRAGGRL
jgi:hypothetical protein